MDVRRRDKSVAALRICNHMHAGLIRVNLNAFIWSCHYTSLTLGARLSGLFKDDYRQHVYDKINCIMTLSAVV